MLLRLKISNFALVDDLELQFEPGLSVLSGETGAGKSVIITALALLLGERADREHIRHGATKAFVEAEFSAERMTPAYRKLYGEHLVDGSFVVTREIARDGSSRAKINGSQATVGRLKEISAPLAEILGQHSSRLLLDEENHLLFLDSFASVNLLRHEVSELFAVWEQARLELARTKRQREDLEKERELLLFQQQEIETAAIRVGEEDELVRERRLLDSSRALIESSAQIESILSDDNQGVLESLRQVRRELDKMTAVDDNLLQQAKLAEEADFQLEELRAYIEQYGASVPDDPSRLEDINLRLDEIYQLKQKYGGSEESVIESLALIKRQLSNRPDTSALIADLERDESTAREAYVMKATQLSEIRRKAAVYLRKLTVKELGELAIESGQFDTDFIYDERLDGVECQGKLVRPFAHGLESCRFLFSANPGEPLKSLVKTASGGEVSRLLLALKAAEKKNQAAAQSLLVFDEVDTGIGGRTAIDVGRKIKALSSAGQVLVITHLHQIARLADHHYLAQKSSGRGKRVVIEVTKLEGERIARELERMVALPDISTADS